MDYLEAINWFLPKNLLTEFSCAPGDKHFSKEIKYNSLYSEFSKLNKRPEFNLYKKVWKLVVTATSY